MNPLRLVAAVLAALLLVLMLATLGGAPHDHSTVGDWLRSPAPGTSHPRPFPLEFYRTPRGLEVVAAASPAPELGVRLDVHLTTATRERWGFLFPTRETSTHHVWGGNELSEMERAQFVSMGVACLRAQGMGEMVSEQLARGELSLSRVRPLGYGLNTIVAALVCFVGWQLWRVLRRSPVNQQRPASSASLC